MAWLVGIGIENVSYIRYSDISISVNRRFSFTTGHTNGSVHVKKMVKITSGF